MILFNVHTVSVLQTECKDNILEGSNFKNINGEAKLLSFIGNFFKSL